MKWMAVLVLFAARAAESAHAARSGLAVSAAKSLGALRQRYEADPSARYGARGVGWLHEQQGLLLGASNLDALRAAEVGQAQRLVIVDVNGRPCDARRVVIWVRLSGPEIIAGLATPSSSGNTTLCSWHFDYTPSVPGVAQLDMKLMTYDSRPSVDRPLDLDLKTCSNGEAGDVVVAPDGKTLQEKGQFARTVVSAVKASGMWGLLKCAIRSDDDMPTASSAVNTERSIDMRPAKLHTVDVRSELIDFVRGWKFYSPVVSCCALCGRASLNADPRARCTHWAYGNPLDTTNPGAAGESQAVDAATGGSQFTAHEMEGVAAILADATAADKQHRSAAVPESAALQKWRRARAELNVSSGALHPNDALSVFAKGVRCLLFNRANRIESVAEAAAAAALANSALRNARSINRTVLPIASITLTGVLLPAQQIDRIYLGCGWSFELSKSDPCIDGGKDDLIFGSGTNLTFSVAGRGVTTQSSSAATAAALRVMTGLHGVLPPLSSSLELSKSALLPLLPTCSLGVTASGSRGETNDYRDGRWVQLPGDHPCVFPSSATEHLSTGELYITILNVTKPAAPAFPTTRFLPSQPGVCWYGDRIHHLGENLMEVTSALTNDWRSPYGRKRAPPLFSFWAPRRCVCARLQWQRSEERG